MTLRLPFTPCPTPGKNRPHFSRKKSLFPQGPFRSGTPPEVYLAAALAVRLDHKIGGESIRCIAKKAGLSPQTVLNILNGTTWP